MIFIQFVVFQFPEESPDDIVGVEYFARRSGLSEKTIRNGKAGTRGGAEGEAEAIGLAAQGRGRLPHAEAEGDVGAARRPHHGREEAPEALKRRRAQGSPLFFWSAHGTRRAHALPTPWEILSSDSRTHSDSSQGTLAPHFLVQGHRP
jgi:hypothetical protein